MVQKSLKERFSETRHNREQFESKAKKVRAEADQVEKEIEESRKLRDQYREGVIKARDLVMKLRRDERQRAFQTGGEEEENFKERYTSTVRRSCRP